MRKILTILSVSSLLILMACQAEKPSAPDLDIQQNQLVVSKMAAVGNSLTAGFQSSGLKEDFQLHSYPYLVAQQMGKADIFEQPLIADPGIGNPAGKTPQYLDDSGNIVQDDLTVDPTTLLLNAQLARPYDNLGIPGINLDEALNALSAQYSGNGFVDIVLRNSAFGGMSQIEQAIVLKPSLLLLWLGNNDVLGAALDGGDATQITSQADFQSNLTEILTKIRQDLDNSAIVMANIPYVTDIPYVNTLDGVFRDSPGLGISADVPVVFDAELNPVNFDPNTNLYIPLLTEEQAVVHITLPGLSAYQSGIGIPDSAALVAMGLPEANAGALEQGMIQSGLNPTGTPMPGDYTITAAEATTIKDAIEGFNQTITTLADNFVAQVIDANSLLTELNNNGLSGLNGQYVLFDPQGKTAFSLDGVHPNNAGYALLANEFIKSINSTYSLSIPELTVSDYAGQYTGGTLQLSREAQLQHVNSVKTLFVN